MRILHFKPNFLLERKLHKSTYRVYIFFTILSLAFRTIPDIHCVNICWMSEWTYQSLVSWEDAFTWDSSGLRYRVGWWCRACKIPLPGLRSGLCHLLRAVWPEASFFSVPQFPRFSNGGNIIYFIGLLGGPIVLIMQSAQNSAWHIITFCTF